MDWPLDTETIAKLPETTVTFYCIKRSEKYDTQKPYFYSGTLPADQEENRTNLEYTAVPNVVLRDLRGYERDLDIEQHGFQFLDRRLISETECRREEDVQGFMLGISKFTEERFAAELVLCYDYNFRRSSWDSLAPEDKQVPSVTGSHSLPEKPAKTPHVDHTRTNGLKRAAVHLMKPEREKYLDGTWRIRIMNFWQPLHYPVEDAPLALCDYSSIAEEDLVAVDRVSPTYAGEVYYVRHHSGQRWYWLSNQTPDETTLFLSFDSDPELGIGPPFCPHGSFRHPMATEATPPRQSIEVRVIVITKKED
ncbi:uncharacterized protein LY89DRAFT_736084 [Mollisia scopiformis]|uniref:Uncharacterized protein n=1 Tax=Mollisia scopiformis TaxID=149040 RepID=A0A194X4N4_MOLSC|nr:uncharacterized protein LY89DRAFT_736084 [Mollisia scopiformis]KUJ15024.1 hypothetical protein LY89DRAFT_736084 [Mollisia scopiformis]